MNQSPISQNPEPQPATPEQPQRVRVQMPVARPVVTYVIMAVTVLVYLGQMASQYFLGGDLLMFFGAKINLYIQQGQYWRFITPVLLHGSILHIGFNMYALYVLGPGLELYYHRGRFLALYLIGGFAGNVISFFFTNNLYNASLGSSTAIFGLLAAEGIFVYQNRMLFGDRTRRILANIVFIAAVNLVIGLAPGSQIDNLGHLGGLAGGLLFAWFAGPILKVEGIPPELRLTDRRLPIETQLAAVGVTAFFAVIAAIKLFLH